MCVNIEIYLPISLIFHIFATIKNYEFAFIHD